MLYFFHVPPATEGGATTNTTMEALNVVKANEEAMGGDRKEEGEAGKAEVTEKKEADSKKEESNTKEKRSSKSNIDISTEGKKMGSDIQNDKGLDKKNVDDKKTGADEDKSSGDGR